MGCLPACLAAGLAAPVRMCADAAARVAPPLCACRFCERCQAPFQPEYRYVLQCTVGLSGRMDGLGGQMGGWHGCAALHWSGQGIWAFEQGRHS